MPWTYTWITDPPVWRVENAADVKRIADQIETVVNFTTGTPDENLLDLDSSQRYSDICEDMRLLAAEEFGDYEFYAYTIAGEPVVLMAVSVAERYQAYIPGGGVWVEGTVASPYVVGAGILMKEFAVNLSKRKGYDGRIGCAAASDEAQSSWERMGMAATGRSYEENNDGVVSTFPVLSLNPATRPSIWESLGGRWIFRNLRYTMLSEPSLA